MKELIFLWTVVIFTAFGCASLHLNNSAPCDIYAKFGATPENSMIAEKITDPCEASRIISLAAKLPVIQFEKEYVKGFNIWYSYTRSYIAGGVTYKSVQDMILLKIAQLNFKAGMTLFILSDDLLVFNNARIIKPKDVQLMTALLDKLHQDVNSLGALL